MEAAVSDGLNIWANPVESNQGGLKYLMAVFATQFLEKSQEFKRLSIPSRMWLHALDECNLPAIHPHELIGDGRAEARRRFGYRKTRSSISRRLSVRDDELPSQMFKTRSQILEDVAQDGTCSDRDISESVNGKEEGVLLRIELLRKGYEVVVVKTPVDFSLERFRVFFSPVQLREAATEVECHLADTPLSDPNQSSVIDDRRGRPSPGNSGGPDLHKESGGIPDVVDDEILRERMADDLQYEFTDKQGRKVRVDLGDATVWEWPR